MRVASLLTVPLSFLLLQSCSDAPAPPAKGTPPFYWQAAQETFGAGDFRKTNDHLEALVRSNNEFTERARPWRLIVLWGLLKGNLDYAEKFEFGARQNKTSPASFRKQVNDSRSVASSVATQLVESWQKYKAAAKSGPVTLDFSFPPGSSGPVAALAKVSQGIAIPPGDIDTANRQAVQRGVILATAKAVGAGEDAPKAREILNKRPAAIPAEVFQLAMTEALLEAAGLFDAKKLDRPDLLKMLANEALAAAKDLPDGKEKKELTTKIQNALKAASKRAS